MIKKSEMWLPDSFGAVILALMCPVLFQCLASGAHSSEVLEKIEDILSPHCPPKDMRNNSVHVYLDLYKILGVDERSGIASFKLHCYIYYYSPSIVWQQNENNGQMLMFFEGGTFWTPDVLFENSVEVEYSAFEQQFVRGGEGMVGAWSSLITASFSCNFDVTHFPFDEQFCPIKMGQWVSKDHDYHIAYDSLFNQTDEISLRFYAPNEQWDLIRPMKYEIQKQEEYGGKLSSYHITIGVRFRRCPEFYTIIFIVPSLVLYILSSLVFLLPVESGEKLTLSITALLAEVVTLDVISNALPASSQNFPVLGYSLIVVITQMSVSVIVTLGVINLHHFGSMHEMPLYLRKFVCHSFLYFLWIKPFPFDRAMEAIELRRQAEAKKKEKGILTVESSLQPINEENEQPIKEFEKVETDSMTSEEETTLSELWMHLAIVVDRVAFIIYSSASVFTVIYFVFQYPSLETCS